MAGRYASCLKPSKARPGATARHSWPCVASPCSSLTILSSLRSPSGQPSSACKAGMLLWIRPPQRQRFNGANHQDIPMRAMTSLLTSLAACGALATSTAFAQSTPPATPSAPMQTVPPQTPTGTARPGTPPPTMSPPIPGTTPASTRQNSEEMRQQQNLRNQVHTNADDPNRADVKPMPATRATSQPAPSSTIH